MKPRPRPRKALTIGAVCKILENEFSDISISKIRYLEDQGLLSPKRTRGGYRLFGEDDVEQDNTERQAAVQKKRAVPTKKKAG